MFSQLLATVVALVLARVLWRRLKYDLHRIPSPPGLPFLGHALDMAKGEGDNELSRLRGRWFAQLGQPKLLKVETPISCLRDGYGFKIHVIGRDLIAVRDWSTAKNVILGGSDNMHRMTRGTAAVRCLSLGGVPDVGALQIMGNDRDATGLMTVGTLTPRVKASRRAYLDAFSGRNLRLAFHKVEAIINEMTDIIEARRQGGQIEVQALLVGLALDAIGNIAFGTRLGGLDGTGNLKKLILAVGQIVREVLTNPLKTIYCRLFPRSEVATQRMAAIDGLTAEWDKITQDILSRSDPPDGQLPLWHALRTLVDPETGNPIVYRDLRAELAAVVIGGMDTTGHQMAWIFALLASHPDVVEKLLQELREKGLYGEGSRELAFEDLGELKYVTAVIKEGMRYCSISGASFPRVPQKDTEVLGYRIPKGTPFIVVGNRWTDTEEEWGDPRVFRPERWLSGEDMSQKHYLGFSTGPRDCVGQRLAMMEMRMAIIHLVRKYSFDLTVPMEQLMMTAKNGLVIEAGAGIWMTFTPRDATDL